jgi:hypothetical protein
MAQILNGMIQAKPLRWIVSFNKYGNALKRPYRRRIPKVIINLALCFASVKRVHTKKSVSGFYNG